MKIKSKNDGETVTITVEGKIDSATAPKLESAVKSEVARCANLVFDFEKLDYISSAGLRILLGAQKIMGSHGVKIINVNETVNDIFEVTGFSLILDIETASS